MNDQYLTILEYDKILDQLAEHTTFSAGAELALSLRPSTDEAAVRCRIQETTEAKALLATQPDLALRGAHDLHPLVKRATLEAMLRPTELLAISSTLIAARLLRQVLTRRADECPLLAGRGRELQPLPSVVEEIARCLDDEGRMLDSASPTLAALRRESRLARERVMQRLRRIITSSEKAHFLQEPIITERNGRYVIPLKTEFKGRIPGIIHDQSASGATLFIEPLTTTELNNQWHQLQLAEQREIERILMELTRLVAGQSEALTRNVELLAELDLALAKGRYSYALRAVPAEICPGPWPVADPGSLERLPRRRDSGPRPSQIADFGRFPQRSGKVSDPTDVCDELDPSEHPLNLIRARHPLLPRDTVVPIDVYVGVENTVLLLTGPNTGGKTVSLKTVGLLAAMSQAGMHIPAAEGTHLPVFTGIYADIGDEQSIEQSLSTFSSHMLHIIDILHRADAGSLVLLDELGAGTDPLEGAALAQALIGRLIRRGCLTMCTSHHPRLKVFALNTPGVQNACVEFDPATLAPTFRLTIGLPGRSNALAIARRLGLAEEIVEQAQGFVSSKDQEADVLLGRIQEANRAAAQAWREAEESRARTNEMEQRLRVELANTEKARRQILDQARQEGRRELEEMRSEISRLRKRLPPHDPGRDSTKEALVAIDHLHRELAPLPPLDQPSSPRTEGPLDGLQTGDIVYVTHLGQTGELLEVSDAEAEVLVGGLRLRTPLGKVQFHSRPESDRRPETRSVRRPKVDFPGLELHLRGLRAEEVAPRLERYLDTAYLAELSWARIVHGKGMGVLKEVVRSLLKDHPLVRSFRPGELAEGGDGVTVVELERYAD